LAEAGVPKVETVAEVLIKSKAKSTLWIFMISLVYELHPIHMGAEMYRGWLPKPHGDADCCTDHSTFLWTKSSTKTYLPLV
jgi:hypothetical protein